MHRILILVTTVMVAATLAGCHEPEPGTGDDNLDVDPQREVSGINVTVAPPSAAPGEEVIVCWELNGHGTVPHTDVHWDNESHPGTVTSDVYDGGFSFPGNRSQQDSEGYAVPRAYCTSLTMEDETIYWRAHVVVFDAPGMLSEEQTIVSVSG